MTRRGVLLTGLAATACGRRSGGPVRIGYQRDGLLLLAKSDPAFEAGLKSNGVSAVEWVLFPSGPPLLEAMRAGAVDVGATGETPPIFAQSGGAQLVYVAAEPVTGASQALLVPPRSTVKSLQDLKGRGVAFAPGSSAHLFALEALASAGFSLSDIKVIPLSPPEAAAAFARGALDGWIVWDSYYALAQRDSGARVLMDGRRLTPTSAFYIASQAFAEHEPRRLSVVLNALKATAARGEADPERAVAVIAQASGLSADIVRTARRRGPFAVTAMTPAVVARQQAAADLFSAARVIPNRVRVAEAVWTGWREAA